MDRQPDKIFREKIIAYRRAASPAAWDRIEANLDRKPAIRRYLYAAASIVVLLSAGLLFVLKSDSPRVAEATETPVIGNITSDFQQLPAKTEEATVSPKGHLTNEAEELATPSKKMAGINTAKIAGVENETLISEIPVVAEAEIQLPGVTETLSTEVLAAPNTKSLTIIYPIREVNAKYLKRKSTNHPVEKEESENVMKISDIAHAIKYNDKGIGDLRQIKDGLLYFEFLASNDNNNKNKLK